MPVSRDQFDADLATEQANLQTYIAAVNAFIALPPVIDLASEDASVQSAIQAIQTAQAQIPPPPGPATPAA